jgi:hypothetical protein
METAAALSNGSLCKLKSFETRQIRKAREAFGGLRIIVALHSSAISSGHEGFGKERKAATSPRTPNASPDPIYAQASSNRRPPAGSLKKKHARAQDAGLNRRRRIL